MVGAKCVGACCHSEEVRHGLAKADQLESFTHLVPAVDGRLQGANEVRLCDLAFHCVPNHILDSHGHIHVGQTVHRNPMFSPRGVTIGRQGRTPDATHMFLYASMQRSTRLPDVELPASLTRNAIHNSDSLTDSNIVIITNYASITIITGTIV